MPRIASIRRETTETKIDLTLDLDGTGRADLSTGIGFFDHMLTHLAKHGLFDLTVKAEGDLHIDSHHTVEDVGICMGECLVDALGNKAGIRRYGSATLPMDETLVTAAVDLSGRPFLVWKADIANELLGNFHSCACRGVLASGFVGGRLQSSRDIAPRPQHPSSDRGDFQGDRPRPAHGGGTRSARRWHPIDQGCFGWAWPHRRVVV